jgi:hypothetical protein
MFRKDNVIGYGGNMYIESHVDGVYRRLECYLPTGEGTYGEPIETTFYRLVERIKNKTLVPGYADGVRYELRNDKMMPIKKEKS